MTLLSEPMASLQVGSRDGERLPAPWHLARDAAYVLGAGWNADAKSRSEYVPLEHSVGRTLAHDVTATAALPRFDTSAMDGWAVAAPHPNGTWSIGDAVLAGVDPGAERLRTGQARRVATGSRLPPGTVGVLRDEEACGVDEDSSGALLRRARGSTARLAGRDVRAAGEEAEAGQAILLAGDTLNSASVALAAATGVTRLPVRSRPTATLLIIGDELSDAARLAAAHIRDVFAPSLPPLIQSFGFRVVAVERVADDLGAMSDALANLRSDFVITSGGTSRGPADYVREAVTNLGGDLVVDSVAMRPGHPVILAKLSGGRLHLALPGNPLAAFVCLMSFGPALADGMLGSPVRPLGLSLSAHAVHNRSTSTRLLACTIADSGLVATPHQGSGMLRGAAAASTLMIVPPGGVAAAGVVRTIDFSASTR